MSHMSRALLRWEELRNVACERALTTEERDEYERLTRLTGPGTLELLGGCERQWSKKH